ncbi:MAG: hypothetical protein G01um10148_366 [Parcubacteria group bacterium Gr01-1014_8]|nr:MAG: hypothetical protein G01um10148_366 [Parcubacteria group bacterium Gr01-1014_8]
MYPDPSPVSLQSVLAMPARSLVKLGIAGSEKTAYILIVFVVSAALFLFIFVHKKPDVPSVPNLVSERAPQLPAPIKKAGTQAN